MSSNPAATSRPPTATVSKTSEPRYNRAYCFHRERPLPRWNSMRNVLCWLAIEHTALAARSALKEAISTNLSLLLLLSEAVVRFLVYQCHPLSDFVQLQAVSTAESGELAVIRNTLPAIVAQQLASSVFIQTPNKESRSRSRAIFPR